MCTTLLSNDIIGRLVLRLKAVSPLGMNSKRQFSVSRVIFDSFDCHHEIIDIHTSCSAPLAVGDQFASLELVRFNGQGGPGAEVIYSYELTNRGSALTGVYLNDIPLGPIAGPFDLAGGESRTFEATGFVEETLTNQATVAGALVSGQMCAVSDLTTVTVVEPCAECKGGTTELTFQYQGEGAADVVVYDDNDAKADKILFQGTLQPGDEFTITPRPGQDKLNSDISIWVNGAFHRKVHTSCSQPIGPGMVVGDFKILSGRSKDNGLMCPLTVCAPQPAAGFEFHDNEIRWDVTNTGDLGLEIERISLSWPAANGDLDEVKRDGDTIHKGDFAPPLAVIESGWEGNEDKRTIKPGETDTLKFKFMNNAVEGEYHIVVEFTAGCTIEIEYVPGQQPTPLVCSDKVQALSLSYTGPDLSGSVTVEVAPDKGMTVVYDLSGLAPGDILAKDSQNGWTVDATASGESELGSKTSIRINGVEEVIHTSCSTPFVAGAPAPLLVRTAIGFFLVELAYRALNLLARYRVQQVAWTATNALRIDLVAHLVGLDLGFHKTHPPGELIERVDGDVDALFHAAEPKAFVEGNPKVKRLFNDPL